MASVIPAVVIVLFSVNRDGEKKTSAYIIFCRARSPATDSAINEKSSYVRIKLFFQIQVSINAGKFGYVSRDLNEFLFGTEVSPPYLTINSHKASNGIAPSKWRCNSAFGTNSNHSILLCILG